MYIKDFNERNLSLKKFEFPTLRIFFTKNDSIVFLLKMVVVFFINDIFTKITFLCLL